MKYAKPSNIISGAKDFYEIVSYYVDKIKKHINAHIAFYEHVADGTIAISYSDHAIIDIIEYIVDPAWQIPQGFDIANPATWGSLSWDDIPRIPDPNKLYATIFLQRIDGNNENAEEALFDFLIENNKLPSTSEWQKI